MKKLPFKVLFEITGLFEKEKSDVSTDDQLIHFRQDCYRNLTDEFNSHPDIKGYKLTHEDVMIIASCWYEFAVQRSYSIDPITVLKRLYDKPVVQIQKLDRLIKLLNKNVFYTSKKEVYLKKHGSDLKSSIIKYNVLSLFEYDVEFHHAFLKAILGLKEDIEGLNDHPYRDNKEFLDDWFIYVDKMYDLSNSNFSERSLNGKLDESMAGDLMEIIDWKNRIKERTDRTLMRFPLQELQEEYGLDENELAIMVYLIKEEVQDRRCDTEELVKLISTDWHDIYRNKEYVSESSRLVRKGLIELSEGVFFLSSSSSVRVAPDIIRRIIMRSPCSEDEKLNQIVKGNDLFNLINPVQSFNDLVLPDEMKKTLEYSLRQYNSNVDYILNQWGLYDKRALPSVQLPRKIEPGMLLLFYGAPGTGKTYAAGAIAHALEKKLLITDISRIQSKWVGESEKNVKSIFTVYERIVHRTGNPPVLLLNEADQFLMQRSSVIDTAVDKMMNSLQNLFLEAFENLRGILIATTNLRGNLDDAFSRRFHLKLEFPLPDIEQRKELWKIHLPDSIPGANEIDTAALSVKYSLTGGQIKIIVKNACTEAACREGSSQRLLQSDLLKYCQIEAASSFEGRKTIGF